VKKVEDVFIKILDNTEKETKKRTVKDARKYILNNWGGIEIYHKDPDVLGCSAEGHISHVLSERLSSRPLGWSKKGAEQMSRLRAFKYNGGTKKELYEILKRNVKVKKLEIKTGKMLNKKKQKSLLPKAKETIPALKKGKVTATFRAVKSLAF
jgi:transposase